MKSLTTKRLVKCRPYVQRRAAPQCFWTVPGICAAYGWPKKQPGDGIIAIVELGGGWAAADMAEFFGSIGQPVPIITDVSVDGTTNSQQNPQNDADYEVALDIQVAAASYFAATGRPALIRVYWAQDIAPAVQAAAADGCAVCSISWGADEAEWGSVAGEALESAVAQAVAGGMVVFAASGDNDSSNGGPNSANVDAPASCPHVIGCGGTTKTKSEEIVWNNNPGQTNGEGTGGGYSALFPVQNWQLHAPRAPVRVPGDKNPGKGRMVPDLAANADPNTGYEIVVYGATSVVGGTSAVAPLMAGLFASLGDALGFIGRKLWKHQYCFRDITQGSNGDYSAALGPDPCSGIGTPYGTAIASLFLEPHLLAQPDAAWRMRTETWQKKQYRLWMKNASKKGGAMLKLSWWEEFIIGGAISFLTVLQSKITNQAELAGIQAAITFLNRLMSGAVSLT